MPLYYGTAYESTMYQSSLGGWYFECQAEEALTPDVVTDTMAYIAATELNSRADAASRQQSIVELGTGVAPFLTLVRAGVQRGISLHLAGCDTSETALRYAEHNVRRAVRERGNAADTIELRHESWHEYLARITVPVDAAYFNPPYLHNGEQVREAFLSAPRQSMYVPDGKEALHHYEAVLPMMREVMATEGLLFIRTPRVERWRSAVAELVTRTFEDIRFTMHQVDARDELDTRSGGGFVVEAAVVRPLTYTVKPVRTIGLALSRQAA